MLAKCLRVAGLGKAKRESACGAAINVNQEASPAIFYFIFNDSVATRHITPCPACLIIFSMAAAHGVRFENYEQYAHMTEQEAAYLIDLRSWMEANKHLLTEKADAKI